MDIEQLNARPTKTTNIFVQLAYRPGGALGHREIRHWYYSKSLELRPGGVSQDATSVTLEDTYRQMAKYGLFTVPSTERIWIIYKNIGRKSFKTSCWSHTTSPSLFVSQPNSPKVKLQITKYDCTLYTIQTRRQTGKYAPLLISLYCFGMRATINSGVVIARSASRK